MLYPNITLAIDNVLDVSSVPLWIDDDRRSQRGSPRPDEQNLSVINDDGWATKLTSSSGDGSSKDTLAAVGFRNSDGVSAI